MVKSLSAKRTPDTSTFAALIVALMGTAVAGVPANASSLSAPQGAPTIDAGPDLFVVAPQRRAVPQATASDPDGIDSIVWTQVSGPPAAIRTDDKGGATFVPTEAGPHVFRMTVKDSTGDVASDELTLHHFTAGPDATVTGRLQEWFKLSLNFTHNMVLDESGSDNPFLNYRLQVTFAHPASGKVYVVPGFFAADGNAAATSATSGKTWRVHFRPDEAGTWQYQASFRQGAYLAIDLDPTAGTPMSFDGSSGTLEVAPSDPDAPGFLSKGRLEYVDGHHLRFAENHEYYLKGGADSPENFLGYYEFDNTYDLGGPVIGLNTSGYLDGLHHYDAHFADFDPTGMGNTWKGGLGQRILGSIDYLSDHGLNSIYFLTFNIWGGDGQEVWPWADPIERTRYDVSKLEQWTRVFDHMNERGMAMHVITQETENDQDLDGGALGTQRKLYYRELVARFSDSLALTWNLGEENTNTDAERKAFADYIRDLDPYDHPITVHTHAVFLDDVYGDLHGYESVEATSMQLELQDAHWRTIDQLDDSSASGRDWVVNYDEQNPADEGVLPDALDPGHDVIRMEALWGNLMAGGGGVEYYFGYANANDDLDCEDWSSRENMWQQTEYALDFFQDHLPFHEMHHADSLTTSTNDYVLAKEGEVYAIFQKSTGAPLLDLGTSTDTFTVQWYNPRYGTFPAGPVTEVTGPGIVDLGTSPVIGDLVTLVRRKDNRAPEIKEIEITPGEFTPVGPLSVRVRVEDPDGRLDIDGVSLFFWRPDGTYAGEKAAKYIGGNTYTLFLPSLKISRAGTWTVYVGTADMAGLGDLEFATFEVE